MTHEQQDVSLLGVEARRIPLGDFPLTLYEQVHKALIPLSQHCWNVHTDAFSNAYGRHLRVNLDLGERPLRMLVDEAGKAVHFKVPVLTDLPARVRPFVEGELAAAYPKLKFVVEQMQLEQAGVYPREVDTLFVLGKARFETFLEHANQIVPELIETLEEIQEKLEAEGGLAQLGTSSQ